MKIIVVTISFFLFSSCTSTMLKIYGMKEIKEVDEKMIMESAKEYNIPLEDNFELDTSYYSFLHSFDSSLFKEQVKNHYQPLQALYFDKSRQLISFQINCYAGGTPNLAWDRDSILNVFPPSQQAPLDNLLTLDTQMKYLRPLSKTADLTIGNYDYLVIIYWNRFMDRQSKRLINFIQQNSKLSTDAKVKIIYANNDNLYALASKK